MFAKTKQALLGNGTQKGVLGRSGIASAIVATAFVALDGWAGGGIKEAIVDNRTALEPLWATAITLMLATKSGR